MTAVLSLWLPILVAAALVFLASSVIHMATPWHKGEYPTLPDEGGFRAAVGPLRIPPGDYMVPRAASMAEAKAPEFVEKTTRGPVMILTVLPNRPMAMGASLVGWFAYALVVGGFAAYLAAQLLPAAASFSAVFRVVAAAAFAGYALALWQMSIWYRRSLVTTLKATVDGLVYALVTAGAFAWLWPH